MTHSIDSSIKIVFITDEGYCLPTCIAITSIIQNRRMDQNYTIYVVGRELSNDSLAKLKELNCSGVKVELIEAVLPPEYCSYTKNDGDTHTTSSALLKFFVPDLLSNVEKVIYLDGDVIIQDDLSELYNEDIDDFYAAVVKDLISDNTEYLRSIDFESGPYFNSGMMLLNLSKIREEHVADKLSIYRINGKNHFVDQDAYNSVFKNHVKYVSLRYNMLNKYFDWRNIDYLSDFYQEILFDTPEENMSKAVVLHFGGGEKPWKHEMGFITALYKEYYYASPYKTIPLKLIDYQNEKFSSEMRRPGIEYLFPFSLIPRKANIILYGAGKIGVQYYKQIKALDYCNVVAWVDQKNISGCIRLDSALGLEYDYIVITTMDKVSADNIKVKLASRGVDEKKIVYLNTKMMFEGHNE